jgi:hypothetical protein
MALTFGANAQYNQLGAKNEFMLKAEIGYAPFMGNFGKLGENGYNLSNYENAASLNVMAGINISQDWFLGFGVGGNYFHSLKIKDAKSLIGATAFIDFDFRPIWKAVMGVDYQPTTIKWAPLMGARIGSSILMANDMLFTPMAEAYGGVNWYYAHGLRNMTHNWHSFYATLGVAYMQQTFFLPVRVGWRW